MCHDHLLTLGAACDWTEQAADSTPGGKTSLPYFSGDINPLLIDFPTCNLPRLPVSHYTDPPPESDALTLECSCRQVRLQRLSLLRNPSLHSELCVMCPDPV